MLMEFDKHPDGPERESIRQQINTLENNMRQKGSKQQETFQMAGPQYDNDLRIVSFPKSLNISCIDESVQRYTSFIQGLEKECTTNPESVVDQLQDENVRKTIKLPTLHVKSRAQNQIIQMMHESQMDSIHRDELNNQNNYRFEKISYLNRRNIVIKQLEDISNHLAK